MLQSSAKRAARVLLVCSTLATAAIASPAMQVQQTPTQQLSTLEQMLTAKAGNALAQPHISDMIQHLRKPLLFFCHLTQQYPTVDAPFAQFVSSLIHLTYSNQKPATATHQREVALTTFVSALAKTLPAHTVDAKVRREAYQQVRNIYSYYTDRALTRAAQTSPTQKLPRTREEKVLRWIKTGAIIAATVAAVTLVGTAAYQIYNKKTPAPIPPRPLASTSPVPGGQSSLDANPLPPSGSPSAALPFSSGPTGVRHSAPAVLDPTYSAAASVPSSPGTPNTNSTVSRNLSDAFNSADDDSPVAAPSTPTHLSASRGLPSDAEIAAALSVASPAAPEVAATEWEVPKGLDGKYTADDVQAQLNGAPLAENQCFLATRLDLDEVNEYAEKLLVGDAPDANLAAKLYAIAAHRNLARHLIDDADRESLARIYQVSRGNGGGGGQRIVVVVKQGQTVPTGLALEGIRDTIGKNLWQSNGTKGVNGLAKEHRKALIDIAKKLFGSHTSPEATAFRAQFDPLKQPA